MLTVLKESCYLTHVTNMWDFVTSTKLFLYEYTTFLHLNIVEIISFSQGYDFFKCNNLVF